MNAFAQSSIEALPTTLKETMAVMGDHFKLIAKQSQSKELNLNSADLTSELEQLTLHSLTFTPEVVNVEPDAMKKRILMTQYRAFIGELYDVENKLEQAFLEDRNQDTQALLQTASGIKQKAHELFK